MRTLILGDSPLNPILAENLEKEGVSAAILADAGRFLKCSGQAGCYTITASDETLAVSSVIITEPVHCAAQEIDGMPTFSLMDADIYETLARGKKEYPIAILLDHPSETPEYIAQTALDLAMRLVARKKKVAFLSKFVKGTAEGMEEACREARDAGVSFIKYETIESSWNEAGQAFSIKAHDGVFAIAIETPYLLTGQCAESAALAAIAKKCRLRGETTGGLNADRFFLHPVFTTRRGIYYLHPALATPGAEESLRGALRTILCDMKEVAREVRSSANTQTQVFPEIDANKCAFCYTCYRACPHAALAPDMENSAMKTVEIACQACGICIAVCPGEAIRKQEPDAAVPGAADEVRGNQTPGAASGKETLGAAMPGATPKKTCKVFCCENGALQAYEAIAPALSIHGAAVDMTPVSCGGRVSADVIAQALAAYDAVLIACCHAGACRHIDGEKRACKQAERAVALLDKAAITGKTVAILKGSHAAQNELKDKIMATIRGL